MAFGTPALDSLVNKSTSGDSGAPEWTSYRRCELIGGATPGASSGGRFTSLWRRDGHPGAGAAPGAVRNPDRTTAGALRPYTNPAGGRKKMLQLVEMSSSERGAFLLADRLLDISGLSGTSTSAQTVGGTLTRYTNGVGNIIIADVYTAIGSSGTTITASYTNQSGTSGRTTSPTAIGGSGLNEDGRSIILSLAQGDTGVQSVQSVTLAASTGTAGDFGVTIAQPLVYLTKDTDSGSNWNSLDGMVECATDACLYGLWLASSTAAPEVTATFAWIDV